MLIGHFGLGFAAKPLAPAVSLGTLFVAAQFLDLLWPTLLRRSSTGRCGLVGLVAAPSPDWRAIAWVGQMQWLLVLAGYWIDSHRQARVRRT